LIKPCEYVFLIEDDGIMGPDALSRLLADHQAYPYAGFVEGVELGRWGIPMVGAWRTDDVYDPTKLESAMPGSGVEEIDAGGLYATLMRYDLSNKHEFKPWGDTLGPDFDMGIQLRQQGYKNFIDWSVAVEHCKPDGTSIHPRATSPVQMRFTREGNSWSGNVIGA